MAHGDEALSEVRQPRNRTAKAISVISVRLQTDGSD